MEKNMYGEKGESVEQQRVGKNHHLLSRNPLRGS